jgi:hypothetical protein
LKVACFPLLVGVFVASAACSRAQDPTCPDTFDARADPAELVRAHRALDLFELIESGEAYRALVFKLPKASKEDSDYRICFYRKEGDVFRPHGAQQNIVNFERPHLSSATGKPRLETLERRLGVPFYFRITPGGTELLPANETTEASPPR